MILGIGTDIVEVKRFAVWKNYSETQLLRVFSKDELQDCLTGDTLNLQKMASRFAAKEAFYKALSQALVNLGFTKNTFLFLFCCQHVKVAKTKWGVPVLKADWGVFETKVGEKLPNIKTELSISHEESYAVAFVILIG